LTFHKKSDILIGVFLTNDHARYFARFIVSLIRNRLVRLNYVYGYASILID